MKNKYRIGTILIALAIFLVTIFFYLDSYKKIKKIYSLQTTEIVLELKKSFLKDTVNNLTKEIDTKRQAMVRHYKRIVDNKYNTLKNQMSLNDKEFTNLFMEQFKNEDNPDLWTAFIWDGEKEKLIYKTGNVCECDINDNLSGIQGKLSSYGMITHGDKIGIFGICKHYIEKNIKIEIGDKIRSFNFQNNSYIWVNEIINYDGGENYAIRKIHPNLPETEGMYLSTTMTDIEGRYPYLEELEGVKEKGELFFNYHFKELESDEVSEKVTYAKLYKDYDWVIGMGIHTNYIQNYIHQTSIKSKELERTLVAKVVISLAIILLVGNTLLIFVEKLNYLNSKKMLEYEMNRDTLTGADSRRCGVKNLETAFLAYQRDRTKVGIMMFDIDHFKHINDNFGHDFGDVVLIKVVKAVKHAIRSSDKLIRWGGDEFVGIFYGLNKEHELEIGEKVLAAISSLKLHSGGEIVSPTVSIGFSHFKESDGDFNDVLKRADEALYDAKRKGRGQVVIYNEK